MARQGLAQALPPVETKAGGRATPVQAKTESPAALGIGRGWAVEISRNARAIQLQNHAVKSLIFKLRAAVEEVKPVEQKIARTSGPLKPRLPPGGGRPGIAANSATWQ